MQIISEQCRLVRLLLVPTLQSQVINNWAKCGRQGKAILLPGLTVAQSSTPFSLSLCPLSMISLTFCSFLSIWSSKLVSSVSFFHLFITKQRNTACSLLLHQLKWCFPPISLRMQLFRRMKGSFNCPPLSFLCVYKRKKNPMQCWGVSEAEERSGCWRGLESIFAHKA